VTRTEYLELLDRNSRNEWGLVSDQSDQNAIRQHALSFGKALSFTAKTEVVEGDTRYLINPQDGELYVTKKTLAPKRQIVRAKMATTPDGDWDEDGNMTTGDY